MTTSVTSGAHEHGGPKERIEQAAPSDISIDEYERVRRGRLLGVHTQHGAPDKWFEVLRSVFSVFFGLLAAGLLLLTVGVQGRTVLVGIGLGCLWLGVLSAFVGFYALGLQTGRYLFSPRALILAIVACAALALAAFVQSIESASW